MKNVTVDMLKWFSLTAQLVRRVSMGTRRWLCDDRIPNVTLHLDKLKKSDNFLVKSIGTNIISYTWL